MFGMTRSEIERNIGYTLPGFPPTDTDTQTTRLTGTFSATLLVLPFRVSIISGALILYRFI